MIRNLLLVSLLPISTLYAQDPVTIALEPFATGLLSPVDIAHCGDERLFIVEQAGRIRIVDGEGTVAPTPFLDIQSRVNDSGGEQGLLGLAFDPDYATNGAFYVNYTAGTGNGSTRVSRFVVTADPNVADPASEVIVYTVPQPYANHNAGDLDFGPDGYLYVPFGDGGSSNDPPNNGQTLTDNALGDMIRIDVSGQDLYTIPSTNPWVGLNNDTLPEIWASGLRNPYRFGFDALTGDLWIGDVGQNQREEVDFWPAGDNSGPNFGWRCYEGDIATPGINDGCPPASSFVAPVSVHIHGAGWCSVIGGRVYRGTAFPRLFGRYIYTDYCPTPYFSLKPDGDGGFVREQVRANNGGIGTSCIAENSALELFVANVETGTIKHIVDQCPMAAPVIAQVGSVLSSTTANSYVWYLNGVVIAGANTQSITIDEVGEYYVVAGFGTACDLTSETIEVIQLDVNETGANIFRIYPSPARDMVMLSGLPTAVTAVRITDMSGRIVATHVLNGADRNMVAVADLANANYIFALLQADGTVIQQRVLQVQH